MSDLGALLRKAREERGLSLEDIQELTKIRKRYLEAIESGDYRVLPGTFYVRAFVKNYSEAVGLDPDEVLRLYQHEVPAAPVEQNAEPIPARKPRRIKAQTSDRLGRFGFNLLMWSFLILIVILIWFYVINKDDTDTNKLEETPITDNASPPPDNSSGSGSGATPSVSPSATPEPTQSPTTVTFSSKVGKADQFDIGPAGGTFKVQLKVTGGRNWVEVRTGSAGGEKLYYANAEDGAVQEYDLTGPLYINVGRSDFTEITVNGVLVPDGDRAASKKLLLQPLIAEPEGAESPEGTQTAE
ncbi:RodZ domain-containing protein [Paenibacillus sp. CAU 1782]